ncbi:uncharacterized protein LOC107608286 [Arachis ipaensis]|uniref:uncharacterized protein LOC107608286 n=1 Tax=Arachis ipaensis TaxID=130454 RepID=UPI0007AFC823|nr:uncharacterized protein LOC107608286 [Arachis ipaensis]XP_025668497.1 uncharacterized protein LOC112766820 [Arachis hypogaea]
MNGRERETQRRCRWARVAAGRVLAAAAIATQPLSGCHRRRARQKRGREQRREEACQPHRRRHARKYRGSPLLPALSDLCHRTRPSRRHWSREWRREKRHERERHGVAVVVEWLGLPSSRLKGGVTDIPDSSFPCVPNSIFETYYHLYPEPLMSPLRR